jgi:hypothetical protein
MEGTEIMVQIRVVFSTLSVALAISLSHGIDKSKWPRVAPIIFVHGVGSAPPTFGPRIDKEVVPTDKPLFPAGDDSKTGGYFWYKAEVDSINHCHDNDANLPAGTANVRYLGILNTVNLSGGTGPDNENLTTWKSESEFKNYGCNAPGYPGWENSLWLVANKNLTTGPQTPNYVMAYDFLQSGTSGLGRVSPTTPGITYDATANTTRVRNNQPPIDSFGTRMNGIEFFDSYWTYGWPDGNVPDRLKGLDGMLYGTALSGTNHKWVKAKWSRNFTRNSTYIAGATTGFKPYDLAGWNGLLLTSTKFDPYDEFELLGGSSYAVGTSGYSNLRKSKTSDVYSAAEARRTITYKYDKYISASAGWKNIITVNYVIEDKGYTGDMLPEETQFGQIGQLYLFIKKVLDKYYRDSNGPNWYLGNGLSDPDARVVLVGHSQGGVISRGVCYPGFQVGNVLEDDYEPMYYPKALANATYPDWDGSAANMNGCWFDVRNHLAGVVGISSPHYGAPIAYATEGVYAMHQDFLVQKAQNQGLYYSIWSKSFLGLDNYVLSAAATEVRKLVDDNNPVSTDTYISHEGFNETIRAGLRTLHNYSSYKTYQTFDIPIKNAESGRYFWEATTTTAGDATSISPPSSPCEPASYPNSKANHYRLYWQPEYDNWVRSFRLDESNNGGISSERVHTTSATPEFTAYGKTLCEEQVGRFTRITDINNPNYASNDAKYSALNPFETLPTSQAKMAAGSQVADVNYDADIKALTDCARHMIDPVTKYGTLFTGLFTPPIANPFLLNGAYEVYDNGSKCLDSFKVASNQTTQGLFHGLLTNAAQGLAYHPASVYLHRLNQRGGTDALAAERRPAPARPDHTPIPFLSVVDNVAATSVSGGSGGAAVNSDLTVNTLSQDIGFAYPDLSKSGSIAKFSITGISHTMASMDRDTLFGGYFKLNTNGAWIPDAEKNRIMHKENRSTLARLFLGLAIGQSPVLANQGPAAAKLSEIESAYSQKDADGFVIQRNNNESVQGKYTRLKGLNPDEILEPVALPYSRDRRSYLVDRVIIVDVGQELFIPAGSIVNFTVSGTIIIRNGGRLTLGGVPTFAGSSPSDYGISFVSGTSSIPDLRFKTGARLKFPDPAAGLLKSTFKLLVNGSASTFMVAGGRYGSLVSIPVGHLYGKYDSRPYQERIASIDESLGGFIYYPGVISAVNSLLQ